MVKGYSRVECDGQHDSPEGSTARIGKRGKEGKDNGGRKRKKMKLYSNFKRKKLFSPLLRPPPLAAVPTPSLAALARQRARRAAAPPALVAPARVRVRLQVRPQHLDVGPSHKLREALRDRPGHQLTHRQHPVRQLRWRDEVVRPGHLVLYVDGALPEQLGNEDVSLQGGVARGYVVVEPLLDKEVGVAELFFVVEIC